MKTAQISVHANLGGDVYGDVMEFGAAPVISLPAEEIELYREKVLSWRPGVIRMPGVVKGVFGQRAERIVGPAFVGYTDSKHFRPVPSHEARPLNAGDERAVQLLRASCEIQDWEAGGSAFVSGAMAGVFSDQELVALASYQPWGEHIAHICVVTHPLRRGRGHAAAAVSVLARIIFQRGLVPQYRTLEANTPSIALARRIGFFPYATSLAIRLGDAGRLGEALRR